MTSLSGTKILFVTLAGSQAHGTATEASDVDLRGICIAPLSVRCSLFHGFEQSEEALPEDIWTKVLPQLKSHPTAKFGLQEKVESVVFDVAKFLRLCASANPNALEILFADERDWVFASDLWATIVAERGRFITKKTQQTYLGYASAQLKKIQTHRSWLLHPPSKKPERSDFGLPQVSTLGKDDQNRIEEALAEKVHAYGVENIEMPAELRIEVRARLEELYRDALVAGEGDIEERLRAVATHALEIPPQIVQTLNAEKKYRGAMKHWESFQTWKRNRNQKRAELERKHGYDTKHAAHLIRLMRTGLEIAESGTLQVRRTDADELLQIRNGGWPYERLIDESAALQERVAAAMNASGLPVDVDHQWVDELSFSLIREGDTAQC